MRYSFLNIDLAVVIENTFQSFSDVLKNGQKNWESSVFDEAYYTNVFSRVLCCNLFRKTGGEKLVHRTLLEGGEVSFSPLLKEDNKVKVRSKEYLSKARSRTDICIGQKDTIDKISDVPKSIQDLKALIAIEFKPFYDSRLKGASNHFMNVSYFRTGKFSRSIYSDPSRMGSFLQDGVITNCKEGQLLQDIVRIARILHVSKLPLMFTAGVFLYKEADMIETLKKNIFRLIEYFYYSRSQLQVESKGKFKNYATLFEYEKHAIGLIKYEDIFVGHPTVFNGKNKKISLSNNEKLYCYPFCVKINK